MQNNQIYIADDSSIQLILLEKVLQIEGFSVKAFNNGPDMVSAVKIASPDLIISDINMPVVNGFELVKKIRNLPQGEDIPCFLVSSIGDAAIRKKVDDSGANGFLKKPFEYQSLIAVIRDLLQENQSVSLYKHTGKQR